MTARLHPNTGQVRRALMTALDQLTDRTNPMSPEQANSIARVAAVAVESAKVEVEFLRVTGRDTSPFLDEHPAGLTQLPGRTIHRIA